MIKNTIIVFLLIATIFLGSLSFALIQSNIKISIENNDLDEELALYEDIINSAAEELRDCKIERLDYQTYIGAYELRQRKRFYNTEAIEWDIYDIPERDMIDIFEEATTTE